MFQKNKKDKKSITFFIIDADISKNLRNNNVINFLSQLSGIASKNWLFWKGLGI